MSVASVASQALLTIYQIPLLLGSVPVGAQRVEMLTLRLRASCERDVAVSSITLTHEGAGGASDLVRVYAAEGLKRISRSATPASRDGRVTIRLRSYVTARCTERIMTIRADVSAAASAGGEHRLTLRRQADIHASAPVRLEGAAGGATPPSPVARPVGPAQGTISVAFLSVPLPVTYGGNRSVARLRLEADGFDDHLVRALTLTNDGKASDADLQRLFLTGSDGKRLTDILPSLDGNTARFTFDPPLTLDRNAVRVLVLHADVLASRRRTIDFILEEASDVEAEPRRGRR